MTRTVAKLTEICWRRVSFPHERDGISITARLSSRNELFRKYRRSALSAATAATIAASTVLAGGSVAFAEQQQESPPTVADVTVGGNPNAPTPTQTSPRTDPAFRPTPGYRSAATGGASENQPYQNKMTGDWDGARTRLHDWGVDINLKYTSETAGNPVGGKNQGTAYTQQVALGAKFDLEKLVGLEGGQFVFTLNSRAGTDLKPIIGSLRSPQELYGAGENTRIAEMYYVQKVLEDHLEFKVGFSPVGDDFATSQMYCYFQSGEYCGHTPALSSDSGGFNYPTAQWGGRVKLQGYSDLYVQTGIYQVNPNLANSDGGFNFDLGFHGTGVLAPIEFGWLPENGIGGLPGKYKIGAYYDTSSATDALLDVNGNNAGLTGLSRATVDGRWGTWIQGEQMIYREPGTANRGLTIFGVLSTGDPRTALYTFTGSVGIVQKGIANRDSDYIGVAVGRVHTNDNSVFFQESLNAVKPGSVNVVTDETIYEIDYGVQVTPWFLLRPDLQYIQRPGGTGVIPNAFVMGLTATVDF
jgi:porin